MIAIFPFENAGDPHIHIFLSTLTAFLEKTEHIRRTLLFFLPDSTALRASHDFFH